MNELFTRLRDHSTSEEQAISVIAELIKLTQKRQLVWSIPKTDLITPILKYAKGVSIAYVAEYREFQLFLIRQKKEKNVLQTWVEESSSLRYRNTTLGVYDPTKKTVWFLPGSRALLDLVRVVESQLSVEGENMWTELPTKQITRGILKASVLEAYNYRCAISQEETREVLELAHILPYAQGGLENVANYIVLRADLHRLFDRGLITISPTYTVIVSPKVTSITYTQYDNIALRLPDDPELRPSVDAVVLHNRNLFHER